MVYLPCYAYAIFECINNEMGPNSRSPTARSSCVYLFLIFTSGTVYNQEVTPPLAPLIPGNDTILLPSSSETLPNCTSLLTDESPAWEPPLDGSVSGASQGSKNVNPVAIHLIQKFSNVVKPFHEKWVKVKDMLGYPNRPNYDVAFNPQHIWEKFHEKGHHFLTGINGAVFGLRPSENFDYPFAYRGLSRNKENYAGRKSSNEK